MSGTSKPIPELGYLIAYARENASVIRRRHFTQLETGKISPEQATIERLLADGVVAALTAHASAEAGSPRPVENRTGAAAPGNAFVHVEFKGFYWQSAVINPALLIEDRSVRDTWSRVITDSMVAVIKKGNEW